LVMITLVVEFHLGLLVEVEENGLQEWSIRGLRVRAESTGDSGVGGSKVSVGFQW
jgi:hypothetical protein